MAGLDPAFEPLWWILFFATALPIHLRGGKFFWTFNFWFAVIILVIEVIYIIATPFGDSASFSQLALSIRTI